MLKHGFFSSSSKSCIEATIRAFFILNLHPRYFLTSSELTIKMDITDFDHTIAAFEKASQKCETPSPAGVFTIAMFHTKYALKGL